MFIFILYLICTIFLIVFTTMLICADVKDTILRTIFVSISFVFVFALIDSALGMSTVNKEVIDAAIEKCDANEGLKSITNNRIIICNNGARFDVIKPEKDN